MMYSRRAGKEELQTNILIYLSTGSLNIQAFTLINNPRWVSYLVKFTQLTQCIIVEQNKKEDHERSKEVAHSTVAYYSEGV